MKKLNIAEILKDCPKGMELDCTMYDNVKLVDIDEREDIIFPIRVMREDGITELFTKYGQYIDSDFAKCVIFPKGKTTWEGFQKPFKDGDILTTDLGSVFILKEPNENVFSYGCYVALNDVLRIIASCPQFCAKKGCRLATEEEKQKLFDAIKANGYKWNPETKTLDKLIEPKFKVGDRIEKSGYRFIIRQITDSEYIFQYGNKILIDRQDEFELVPNKFDITTLKPFDKVLVRDNNKQKWTVDMFSFYDKTLIYPFNCIGHFVNQCIPYENNEHLLGTTNDCDEYYKTWE